MRLGNCLSRKLSYLLHVGMENYGLASIALAFIFFSISSFGQGYKITFNTEGSYLDNYDLGSGCSQKWGTASISNGAETYSSWGAGQIIYFSNKPTKLMLHTQDDADIYGYCIGPIVTVCSYDDIINLTLSDCDSYSALHYSCTYMDVSFTIEPVVSAPTGTAPSALCSNQNISLTGTNAFAATSAYNWEYKTQTGSWNSIASTVGISVSMQDIFGPGYASHYNENVYFRYNVSCIASATVGPYTFSPPQVSASFSTLSPICKNGADGSISILSYNRSPISGEIFSYEVHTSPDLNPISNVGNVNLVAGDYYGVVRSNFGCGPLTFTPIKIPSGPRNPLSANLSVTSNYNGAQISCASANDGKIAVNATGGNGIYAYSLNGGGFGGLNVFSVGAGSHIVTVKDGCSTPTIANTNTVTLTAPSAVSISSLIPSTCNAYDNGQITVAAAGGTGSYNYSINGGSYQGSNLFSGLHTPSTYIVGIRDLNNCTSSQSVSLVGPIVAGSVTPPACTTGATVALSVSGSSGGSGNLKWEIRDGSTDALIGSASSISNSISAPPGTFNAKVIDVNYPACSANTAPFTVNTPVSASVAQTPASINCFGGTATLTAIPTGGVSPYTSYVWNGVIGGTSFSNAGSGAYSVTFQDSNGCSASASKTVTTPTQVLISSTLSNFNAYNVSCKGGANGAINITPSGGTPIYTYAWSTTATSQNLSGLSAGSYSITVKDSNGCDVSQTFTLTEPSSSVAVAMNSKGDVTCYGSNNGTITVTGSGGVGAMSFSKDNWITSQLSASFSALPAATYTISARDANGCNATTSPILINTPVALSISSITKTDPLCNGTSTGSLFITATGGMGSYSYSNGAAYASSSTFSNLSAGGYMLSVKDGNGCTVSSPIQTLVDPAVLNSSYVTTQQSCAGIVDGSITLTGTGGTSPYTFSNNNGTSFQSSGSFAGLAANNYSTVIKDNHGCTAARPVTVNIQAPLLGVINRTSPINCYGQSTGALSVSASGGTSPYNYAWSNGSTAQNINSLVVGSYSVVIKDSKNCTTSESIVLDQPTVLSLASINSNYNSYGVSCKNSTDGFINVTPSGGTSPYTYSWNTGATSSSISAIAAGTYAVTVTDLKNCIANLPITLLAPEQLDAAINSKTNATCHGENDGSFTVTTTGGVGSYTYSIDGVAWQSSPEFSSLTANSYLIQVKDANSCTSVESVDVVEPPAITISIGALQEAGCGLSNGSILSSASGGTGTLNYLWRNASNQIVGSSAQLMDSPSGIYSLAVTDQSGCSATTSASISSPDGPLFSVINQEATSCSYSVDGRAAVSIIAGPGPYVVNWGDGETGTSAIHLAAGSTTVTVTDANNCSTIQSFTTASPLALSLNSIVSNSPTCPNAKDGSIQITATGGKAPYTYLWNGNQGSNSLTNIFSGAYSLVVTDASSCTYSQNISVADIAPIGVNVLNQVTPSCASSADGSLFVQATGGNGSFSYSWNTSMQGQQLNSIAAGNYTVTVNDNKNCSQQKTITLVAPTPVTESLAVEHALCNGGDSGTILSTPSGGTGTYTFSRDNGDSWQTQNLFSRLSAGNYQILVKDLNGCTTSSLAEVTEPPPLAVSITKADPTCGQANGTALATVSGGTGTYRYQWYNSISQPFGDKSNLQNAPSDEYTFTVKDANNCVSAATVSLAPYPSAKFVVNNIGSAVCSYSADGSARVDVLSARSPYLISWSSGENSESATKLRAGENSVKIKDANNCEVVKIFLVPSPTAISLISETIANPVCAGDGGTIQVISTGGTGNLLYTWNGVAGGNYIQNGKAGRYDLMIRDAAGCALSKTYSLIDPPPLAISLGADQTICPRTTTSIGSTLPNATYLWSGPGGFTSTQSIVNVGGEGQYRVTVTDSKGCKASSSVTISISENLLKADFLTASKAHAGDTLAMIDISWPIPDQIKWQADNGAAIVYSDNDYALVTFLNPGIFKIGLTATQGGCQDTYYQTVAVDEEPMGGMAKHEGGDLQLSSMTVFPNPFDGKTNTRIELSDVGNVTLKVYSLVTNSMIMMHEFEGDKVYNTEIDFSGREAGLYIILIEYGSNTKAIRVIKL